MGEREGGCACALRWEVGKGRWRVQGKYDEDEVGEAS